jgi:hypothetical protein
MLLRWLFFFSFGLLIGAILYPKYNGWRFNLRWAFLVMSLLAAVLGLFAAGALAPPE